MALGLYKPLIISVDMICVSAWLKSGQGQLSPAPGERCDVREWGWWRLSWDTELTQTRVTCSHGHTLRQGSSLCNDEIRIVLGMLEDDGNPKVAPGQVSGHGGGEDLNAVHVKDQVDDACVRMVCGHWSSGGVTISLNSLNSLLEDLRLMCRVI